MGEYEIFPKTTTDSHKHISICQITPNIFNYLLENIYSICGKNAITIFFIPNFFA